MGAVRCQYVGSHVMFFVCCMWCISAYLSFSAINPLNLPLQLMRDWNSAIGTRSISIPVIFISTVMISSWTIIYSHVSSMCIVIHACKVLSFFLSICCWYYDKVRHITWKSNSYILYILSGNHVTIPKWSNKHAINSIPLVRWHIFTTGLGVIRRFY